VTSTLLNLFILLHFISVSAAVLACRRIR